MKKKIEVHIIKEIVVIQGTLTFSLRLDRKKKKERKNDDLTGPFPVQEFRMGRRPIYPTCNNLLSKHLVAEMSHIFNGVALEGKILAPPSSMLRRG